MNALIDAAFDRSRTALLTFVLILIMGAAAWLAIPKEAEPDVTVPIIYVSMNHEGISPEDAERLLLRPMERELQSIEGIKEMRSTGTEGHASVLLEFDPGFDPDQALQDVRAKVDLAKAKLPADTDEPVVHEINLALFPVLTVALSGPLPERSLVSLARDLQDQIEGVPGVLEVTIGGDREELLEILVEETVMETYGVSYEELFNLIRGNNRLVAAGVLDTGAGRLSVKVPGVIEDIEDVLRMPVKVSGDRVVTFADVASVRRTYKDPQGFARIDGQPTLALEVSKRVGANIIETVEAVRAVVENARPQWPETIQVTYLQDKSEQVRELLADLQKNVVTAVVLVMLVIVAALGWRPALLVGLAIPGSFLAGILTLYALGYTLNIIVLFSLILVVGMLVDGAIVVVELAERRLAEGMERRAAYAAGAKRMAWPIIASTATTLAVFLPLVVWPGMVGEFMKYLPITVLVTLSASLLMALVFVPVIGGRIARAADASSLAAVRTAESGDLAELRGFTGLYVRTLERLLRRPLRTLAAVLAFMVATYAAYGLFGHGVSFFPDMEPEVAQVQVHARGDLSAWEKDALVRAVEERVLGLPEVKTLYARSMQAGGSGNDLAEDTIGVIQLDLIDWDQRRPARLLLEEIRERTAAVPGVVLEVREQEHGPGPTKPVEVELSGHDQDALIDAVAQVRAAMEHLGGFVDAEDNRPLPGVEWRLIVNRERAARYGADVGLIGNAVQLVTTGIKVAEYRPDDADDEVDIRVRFPADDRGLDRLMGLRVPTAEGLVPIRNFVEFRPSPKTGTVTRTDARRAYSVSADVAEGVLADQQVQRLKAALAEAELPKGVEVTFKGEDEEQREAMVFLSQAFVVAVFLMAIMLVTQFNSLYQAFLVLSAIVLSTAGVLLGLLVTGQSFGIVMSGLGTIALAGIVVNNNIVLIDTFNDLRRRGLPPAEAILRTAAQRLRPVLLTSITTVLGLMPMVLGLNIDVIGRAVEVGAPSTQWWTQLSSSIAGGLAFATVLTLLLTPSLLMLGEQVAERRRIRASQRQPEPTAAD
jgi:multidrug efflux pump